MPTASFVPLVVVKISVIFLASLVGDSGLVTVRAPTTCLHHAVTNACCQDKQYPYGDLSFWRSDNAGIRDVAAHDLRCAWRYVYPTNRFREGDVADHDGRTIYPIRHVSSFEFTCESCETWCICCLSA